MIVRTRLTTGGIPLRRIRSLLFLSLAFLGWTAAERPSLAAPLSASLAVSIQSPAPVGTVVTWTASAGGSLAGNVWYRFRVRDREAVLPGCAAFRHAQVPAACAGSDFSMVRDYAPLNTLAWTAGDHEGEYDIEVTARDNDSGETSVAVSTFQFTSRVTGDSAVISATTNPLVFLYSAPPCQSPSTMRVQFQAPDGSLQSTSAKPCTGQSMNFYVAGMRTGSIYSMQHVIDDSADDTGASVLAQVVPDTSFTFANRTLTIPPVVPTVNPIVLQSRFGDPAATDMQGNLIWYSLQDVSMIARPEPGGFFLGWFEGASVDLAHQTLREFDLAGTVLRETNAARINEQLAAMGMHSINTFHHEARPLPDGGILALAASERILTDVQGPGPVDVIGDIILVLDRDLQVQWAWDTFDHLDVYRRATQNEVCVVGGGCPPIHLAAQANDWTHGNALQLTADGNILYSARHQDWVVKIDYENGSGNGAILWRLGKGGDFTFVSSDPYPWFSHQHDASVDSAGILTVFDNGNLRYAANPFAHSRGQVIQLDEVHRTATLLVNADLGDYSAALGSAQSLPNGNYHFHLGDITSSQSTRIVEVDPSGSLVYDMHVAEIEYRSFRMQDLYTP